MRDSELLDIVDEHDVVVGTATRKEVHTAHLRHRGVHTIVFDHQGRMALQLRSAAKRFCPLHWMTAASGHVQSGEDYEHAAMCETREELGVDLDLTFFSKDLFRDSEGKERFLVTFTSTSEGPFAPNPDEVERVAFFTLEQIRSMIDQGEKMHPVLLFLLKTKFGIERTEG